ncbi:MAG: hypothetical protein R3C01_12145 [Planctomycetaceae bacterium]
MRTIVCGTFVLQRCTNLCSTSVLCTSTKLLCSSPRRLLLPNELLSSKASSRADGLVQEVLPQEDLLQGRMLCSKLCS